MRVRFIGEPGGHQETTVFGETFLAGEYVTVTGPVARKLSKNPMFEVEGSDEAEESDRSEATSRRTKKTTRRKAPAKSKAKAPAEPPKVASTPEGRAENPSHMDA